jgi:hypothetical protein
MTAAPPENLGAALVASPRRVRMLLMRVEDGSLRDTLSVTDVPLLNDAVPVLPTH